MSFADLQQILAHWYERPNIPEQMEETYQTRLCLVLRELQMGNPRNIGTGDLAGLVRHVLEVERTRQPVLRVPRGYPWPELNQWKAFGLSIASTEEKWFVLELGEEWRPRWLATAEKYPPLRSTFAGTQRRRKELLPADPSIADQFGFTHYTSSGQRQAVRSVICSQPGAVLLINLPTGAGKSLVMYAPAFNSAENIGVTVVVVPTVALALDQERQVWRLFKRNGEQSYAVAWHSGLTLQGRREIVQRITDGTQRILFAAPESLVGPLLRPLCEAARRGFLRYFIFDEAHLIAGWGNEFRPEFQSVAGVRRNLLALCPTGKTFKTLFLTATLTEESAATISTMIGAEEVLEVIAAVYLRPEPEYWIYNAASLDAQVERVLEVSRMVPRPFLLYVTRREDAKVWVERLRQHLDIRRVAAFHGATPPEERRTVLDKWRSGDLDAIVATSAFGLGMDKADVRSVIHACVPETVDRFYQEVGRAGRDGKTCASFLIWTEEDRRCARTLARDRIITIEKGLARWNQMLFDGEHLENHRWKIHLSSKPPWILQDSEANEAWNLRTLILLARSGMIAMEAGDPPEIEIRPDETMQAFEARRAEELKSFYLTCTVLIRHPRHHDKEVWRRMVESERTRTAGWDNREAAHLDNLLGEKRRFAEILKEIYTISPECPLRQSWHPVAACGGCGPCRSIDHATRCAHYNPPEAEPIAGTLKEIKGPLQKILANSGCDPGFVVVSCTPPESQSANRRWIDELITTFLTPLVKAGILEIAAPAAWLKNPDIRQLYRKAPNGFLMMRPIGERDSLAGELQVPRLSILDPREQATPIPEHLFHVQRPVHLLLVPENIPETAAFPRLFCDVSRHLKKQHLIRSLNQ